MQAIILARRDFRENDQIISLFSEEKGKITALARGVKKIISKNAAFLEPFFFVESEVIPGRELRYLTKVVGLKSYKNIRADFQKSIIAGRVAIFVDRILEDGQSEPKIFYLLRDWFDFVDGYKAGEGHYYGFIVRLFRILGYEPILEQCVFCKKAMLSQVGRICFAPASGGIFCGTCNKENICESDVLFIDNEDASHWEIFLNQDIRDWPLKVSIGLKNAIMIFSEYHIDKKLAKISQI